MGTTLATPYRVRVSKMRFRKLRNGIHQIAAVLDMHKLACGSNDSALGLQEAVPYMYIHIVDLQG